MSSSMNIHNQKKKKKKGRNMKQNYLHLHHQSHPFNHKFASGSGDSISLLSPLLLTELDAKLRTSFVNKQSASMVVVGNPYESQRYVQHTISEIQRKEKISLSDLQQNTIYLDGSYLSSDQEAFISLSDQCLLRSNSKFQIKTKNLSSVMEDIEAYFHQCHLNEIPSIILVENFHVFARNKRQTFIYTLFDLVHRNDLFFIIIGLTPEIDLYLKLEKRVLSRLNSQFFYLKKLNSEFLCQYFLYNLLLFPIVYRKKIKQEEDKHKNQKISHGPFDIDLEEKSNDKDTELDDNDNDDDEDAIAQYCIQFNQELAQTFGYFLFYHEDKTRYLHQLEHDEDITKYKFSLSKEGEAASLLEMLVDWGRDLKYFDLILFRLSLMIDSMHAVSESSSSSDSSRFITARLLQSAIEQQEVPTLSELLINLGSYELQLYSMIARRQCQQLANHNHVNPTIVSDGFKEITMDDVLADFDKMTNLITKKILPIHRILQILSKFASMGLIQLWNPSQTTRNQPLMMTSTTDIMQQLSPQTIITTVHTQYEILSSYKIEKDELFSWKTIHPLPLLKMPEKTRRAVLDSSIPIQVEHR